MANNDKPCKNNGTRRKLSFTEEKEQPSEQENPNDATDQLEEMSENLLNTDREEMIKKWNFDFVNEVPLNGDWEWERVAPEESIPKTDAVVSKLSGKKGENRNI